MSTIYSHSRKDQIVITIPTDEYAAEYFKILNSKLQNSYVFNREIKGNLITFKGSIFRFVWNGWNVFNTISKGKIEFLEEDGIPFISSKIYFTESIIIALIFHLIPFFAFIFEPGLSIAVFFVIWLSYAITYFVSIFRFNSYVAEILIQVNLDNGYRFKTDIPARG